MQDLQMHSSLIYPADIYDFINLFCWKQCLYSTIYAFLPEEFVSQILPFLTSYYQLLSTNSPSLCI